MQMRVKWNVSKISKLSFQVLLLTAKLIIVSSYHLFRRESSAIEWRKGIISFTVNRN